MMSRNLFVAAIIAAFVSQAASAAAPHYALTKTVTIGAPDRWDYMHFDPPSGRLYIAHGDEVTVLDGRSGAFIGNVTGMPGGTHGIGISHATGQGFTDDGKAGMAIAFDLKTLKVTHRIKVQPDADGIAVDPRSGHVFVIDGDSGKVSVIAPQNDRVIATVNGGGKLEFGVFGDNSNFYVNGAGKGEVVRINAATNNADAHWPLPGCKSPHGLAIDNGHHRLFATCSNARMEVLNSHNGKIIATLPIGKGSDAARFDVKRDVAYSSNFDGTLSPVVEKTADQFSALAPIKTELGARTMAIDPESGRIYVVTADITVNKSAAPHDWRHRYKIKSGSARVLFLDPVR